MVGQKIALSTGDVRGTAADRRNGVRAFLGIPYAQPPLGPRRWRPPVPAAPWGEVRDATRFGPSAPTALPSPAQEHEDCLYVNVWTSASTPEQRAPVMVWIPGGGFQESNSARPNIDGSRLAGLGAVIVSFNYRAGVLGFLAHPELDAEGTPSGNFGLQDQIQALRWVRENIAVFGGDPGNVTIFGESAGAASVALLMASPLARGLFHRAIGQSSGYWESIHGSLPTAVEARSKGAGLLEDLDVADIEEARRIPVEELMSVAGWSPPKDPLRYGFSPSVDGFVVPDHPMAVFAAGRQSDVPLLAGWNAAEGATFLPFEPWLAESSTLPVAFERLFGDRANDGRTRYPVGTEDEAQATALALAGDAYVAEATWSWIQDHRRTGTAPVYAYHFDLRTDYTPVSRHAVDIDYVFGMLGPHWLSPPSGEPDALDREVSRLMSAYWVNFARNGDPNGEGLPPWPEHCADDQLFMVLCTESRAEPLRSETDRLEFLRSLRGADFRRPGSWRSASAAPPATPPSPAR
ncbi:MAG: carboxylesterase/lipase family protein [Leucobacter sp.]